MSSITLGDFILTEMEKRDMSARQFAQFIGVSHGTINRFVDFGSKDVGYPSIDFIEKLAVATQTPISMIMELILPHLANQDIDSPDSEALLIAQQLQRLSEAERKTIYAMIRGVLAEHEKT